MHSRRTRWLVLTVAMVSVLALAATGCGGAKPSRDEPSAETLKGSITAVGSTALQPLVERAAEKFMAAHPETQIVVQGGGSGTGLSQVSSGAADIGNSDIFAEEKTGIDASQLVDHRVCVVGMAAVINPDAKVDNLTKQQLIDVFTGKIKNWKEVGGADIPVVIVNRAKGSGTRATFKKYALDGSEEATGMEEESSGAVKKIVGTTPGAISYLALSYLDSSVTAVKLDGVAPTKENVTSGKYPVWAYEHMYTKGEPTGLTKAFLDFMMMDEIQTQLVPQTGYIPATEMQVERDWQGNVKPK